MSAFWWEDATLRLLWSWKERWILQDREQWRRIVEELQLTKYNTELRGGETLSKMSLNCVQQHDSTKSYQTVNSTDWVLLRIEQALVKLFKTGFYHSQILGLLGQVRAAIIPTACKWHAAKLKFCHRISFCSFLLFHFFYSQIRVDTTDQVLELDACCSNPIRSLTSAWTS